MSELFSTDNIIFSIGGQGVSLIEILSVASGLTCVYLATRAKVANFWVGYAYNILLFILFLSEGALFKHAGSTGLVCNKFLRTLQMDTSKKGEENKSHQLKVTLMTQLQEFALLFRHLCWLWFGVLFSPILTTSFHQSSGRHRDRFWMHLLRSQF
jgi:nicotinamide riboside transporter PnuC